MSGKWISLLLLSLTAAAPASGGNQSRPLNMETLSVVDGLSSNYVSTVTTARRSAITSISRTIRSR